MIPVLFSRSVNHKSWTVKWIRMVCLVNFSDIHFQNRKFNLMEFLGLRIPLLPVDTREVSSNTKNTEKGVVEGAVLIQASWASHLVKRFCQLTLPISEIGIVPGVFHRSVGLKITQSVWFDWCSLFLMESPTTPFRHQNVRHEFRVENWSKPSRNKIYFLKIA